MSNLSRILKTAVLFGAISFGQQAFAQESPQQPTLENGFRIPRFSREKIVQYAPYQGSRKYGFKSDFFIHSNSHRYGESRNPLDGQPAYRTFSNLSKESRPFYLFNNKVSLTFFSSKKSKRGSSIVHVLIRRIAKIGKGSNK